MSYIDLDILPLVRSIDSVGRLSIIADIKKTFDWKPGVKVVVSLTQFGILIANYVETRKYDRKTNSILKFDPNGRLRIPRKLYENIGCEPPCDVDVYITSPGVLVRKHE